MLLQLLVAFTSARFYENIPKFYAQWKSTKGGRWALQNKEKKTVEIVFQAVQFRGFWPVTWGKQWGHLPSGGVTILCPTGLNVL